MRWFPLGLALGLMLAAPLHAQLLSYDDADADGDGRVSRDEYRIARERQFASFDTNGDGVVSSNDFVHNTTHRTSLDKIDGLIAAFDIDGNGVVSRDDLQGSLPVFDTADADRDGFLDEAEMGPLRAIVERRRRASR